MTTPIALLRLQILLIFTVIFASFSPIFAQNDTPTTEPTEAETTDKKVKDKRKDVSSAEKNVNDLRKINVLLAIAQDRDRQAGEAVEEIRSKRLRIEEDMADVEDNVKKISKKEKTDLDTQLKSLQKKEKLAQKTRETANNFLLEVTQAVAAEPSKRSKFIGTYERKFGPIIDAKPNEQPSEVYEPSEKDKSQAVVVSEKIKTPESTPSVSESNLNENPSEKAEELAVSTSKKKNESKTKKNEKPKKVVDKSPNKKNKKTATPEETKKEETFPLVFNEPTNTPLPTTETVDPAVEQPKEDPKPVKKESKKETKKTSKKKEKKEDTTTATMPKADDFPVVFSENNTPTTTNPPADEPVLDNTAVTPSQGSTPLYDVKLEQSDEKTTKKTKKNDKKPKKNSSPEAAQGSLVSYKTYDRNVDVFMKSPAPECAIAYEGKDEFTGKNKRETAPARFFAHTEELMKKGMQDKDFITCDITGTKVENSRYTYLNMTITVLSKDIQRTLGFLDRGTPIIFVLVNGKKITMRTNKTDIGVVDIDKGLTIYKAQLTAESITDLTESELDYVRVNWSSGYEDYEVYDVDVLKNLFNCLYKK
jgi:hypothetical protein